LAEPTEDPDKHRTQELSGLAIVHRARNATKTVPGKPRVRPRTTDRSFPNLEGDRCMTSLLSSMALALAMQSATPAGQEPEKEKKVVTYTFTVPGFG